MLGASESGIVRLLASDFIRLIMIAVLVASPVSLYLMHHWLQRFAYHISMPWWVFAVIGLLAIIIAFATIGLQSMRAALANPVDSLRNE